MGAHGGRKEIGVCAVRSGWRDPTERGMEQRLRTPLIPRPQWTTGLRLQQLLGPEVGVTAKSFFAIRRNGGVLPTAIPVRELILPDDTAPRQLTVLLRDRPHRSGRHTPHLLVTLGALAAVRSAGGSRSPRRTSPVMRCGRQCGSRPSPAGSAGCTTTTSMTPGAYAFAPLTRGWGRRHRPSTRNEVLLWLTKPWYKTSATSRSQR
jgi:hypothetical protein